MARKSAKLRLSQSSELFAKYTEAGLETTRAGMFIRDMIVRLDRGKGLSQGQRRWLDSLIEEGIPTPKGDEALIAAIDEAIATPGMERRHDILRDFRHKAFNGWNLSTKQATWLDSMIAEAKKLREEGPWQPSEEQISIMRDIAALSRGYNSVYWASHGGTYRAVEKIRLYLGILDLDAADHPEAHRKAEMARVGLDEWCLNKAKKAMAGRLRELREQPYAKSGDLVWTRYRAPEANWNELQWFQAPVCGNPEVSERGHVVYPILNPILGLIMVSKDEIAKRKPRGA